MSSRGRLTRTVIRWSAPGISLPFPLLRAHAESEESEAAREALEAAEAQAGVQSQRPTHRMLPPEQTRLKQHQPQELAVVGEVVGAALPLLELPTRHLKLLSPH